MLQEPLTNQPLFIGVKMKTVFALTALLMLATPSMAATKNKCSFVTQDKNVDYSVDDQNGVLNLNGESYQCASEYNTVTSNYESLCRKKGSDTVTVAIALDGAEGDFMVFKPADSLNKVCSGVATGAQLEEVAKQSVSSLYGRAGDTVSATLSDYKALKNGSVEEWTVSLTNGPAVGSAAYKVLITKLESASEGKEVASIKVTYLSGN
jgi:hypothetical protein